ncbi:MAG: hypothetical protein CMM58_08715 [Rhodospirillaceae bacterium]|mgnify:CR=1 FL=1|nr:hypothetical protein [Rhodospirillaceae bacterium]|tara:strand:- start:572 stop:1183 length:612 start_codon:yes stop_codon:yes gene_type:complete
MKLYGTTTSPYARITRIIVFEKHLQDRVKFIWTKTRVPNDPLLSVNPSGRIPFLLLEDGTGIEDTPTIVDYLDTLESPELFDPRKDRMNWEYRRIEATAKAMLDGLAVWAREIKRPLHEQSPEVIRHETERASRLTAVFDKLMANPVLDKPLNMAQLYLFAALDLERRIPTFLWRVDNSSLADWMNTMNDRPSVKNSCPPLSI